MRNLEVKLGGYKSTWFLYALLRTAETQPRASQ
jgi:hypothetical protein